MRIAHIGDTHWGLGYQGPREDSRFQDIDATMTWCAEKIIEKGCDVVLFAGDAFQSSRMYIDRASVEIRAFSRWLRTLSEAEIPVVVISGTPSHDSLPAYEIIRDMQIPGVTVQTTPKIVSPIEGLSVACIPGMNRSMIMRNEDFSGLSVEEIHAEMGKLLRDMALGMRVQGANVLLTHLTVGGASKGFNDALLLHEPVLPQETLAHYPLSCLGHIHVPQEIPLNVEFLDGDTREAKAHAFYCGSPERLSFNDENVQTGFWIHDLGKDKSVRASEFVETTSRRFLTLDHSGEVVEDEESLFSLEEETAIPGAIVRFMGQSDRDSMAMRKSIMDKLYALGAFFVSSVTMVSPMDTLSRDQEHGFAEGITPVEAIRKWGEANGLDEETIAELQEYANLLAQKISA